jgi:hypothetical protein
MTPRIQPIDPSSAGGDPLHDRHRSKSRVQSAALTPSSTEDLQHQNLEERWSDVNIQNVVERWNLSETEERQLRELEHQLSDVDHWKNNPLDAVRFLRGPGAFDEVATKLREMIEVSKKTSESIVYDNIYPVSGDNYLTIFLFFNFLFSGGVNLALTGFWKSTVLLVPCCTIYPALF